MLSTVLNIPEHWPYRMTHLCNPTLASQVLLYREYLNSRYQIVLLSVVLIILNQEGRYDERTTGRTMEKKDHLAMYWGDYLPQRQQMIRIRQPQTTILAPAVIPKSRVARIQKVNRLFLRTPERR